MKPDLTPHLDRLAGDACDYHVENTSAPTGNHANAEELRRLRAENARLKGERASDYITGPWLPEAAKAIREIEDKYDIEVVSSSHHVKFVEECERLRTQVVSLEAAGELLAEANRQAEAEIARLLALVVESHTLSMVKASPEATGSGGEADLPAAINTVAAHNRAELAQGEPEGVKTTADKAEGEKGGSQGDCDAPVVRRLLPCPFCGCDPWGVFGPHPAIGEFWVECHGNFDAGETCGDWYYAGESVEETIEAWNKRAMGPKR